MTRSTRGNVCNQRSCAPQANPRFYLYLVSFYSSLPHYTSFDIGTLICTSTLLVPLATDTNVLVLPYIVNHCCRWTVFSQYLRFPVGMHD